MSKRLCRGAVVGAVAVLITSVLPATTPAQPVALDEVLATFDRVQQSIRTLSADFTETVTSTLLKEEIVAKGKVFLTKPDAVRWEYSAPEEMRFVIAKNQYTGYFPLRGEAEKRNVQRWREQLFRLLGLGQASDELAKFYTIRLAQSEPPIEGALLLELDPIKKRVRKRMDTVRFWISDSTFLPVRVEYNSKNGNTRLIEFDQVNVNPELSASLYEVDLPPDVNVTKGFSALSGLSVSSGD